MSRLQEALDRAFPIFQMGGLSGAMYPADEGEGQGWAISNEDWEVIAGVVRELIEDPVAVVRRGVESGTIKGEVVEWCETHKRTAPYGGFTCSKEWELLVKHRDGFGGCSIVSRTLLGSVSDGGSET